jgi:4-alpha-glucanotransferase
VSYRADELAGIVALESRRQGAVVVAEDLGTLPPELPRLLADWGFLRSAVMRFERDDRGAFRPPEHYPPRALVTLGTHDLPPFAGFLSGADLELRHQAGAIASDAELAAARAERESERALLVARLSESSGFDPADAGSSAALLRGSHAFLARTPCVLAAASLDDLAGEETPVNLPGVPLERHLSWSRHMGRSLDKLLASPELAAEFAVLMRGEVSGHESH